MQNIECKVKSAKCKMKPHLLEGIEDLVDRQQKLSAKRRMQIEKCKIEKLYETNYMN